MKEEKEPIPRKRRRRRSNGEVLHLVSVDTGTLDARDVYRSEDGAYEVSIKDGQGIALRVLTAAIVLPLVTWFIMGIRDALPIARLLMLAVFWLPAVWLITRDVLLLWRHPLIDDKRQTPDGSPSQR